MIIFRAKTICSAIGTLHCAEFPLTQNLIKVSAGVSNVAISVGSQGEINPLKIVPR